MVQGVVAVVIDGKTAVKAITRWDGYNADLLAAEIRREHMTTPEQVFAAALRVGFGHEDDLVVQGPDKNLYRGGEELSLAGPFLDRSKFQDPGFNPRREGCPADHVALVRLPG